MRITFVIDKDFDRKRYIRHNDACHLMEEAMSRGHEIYLVHPQRIKNNQFSEVYKLIGNTRDGHLELVDQDLIDTLILVRSYGYNRRTLNNLVGTLENIESRSGLTLDCSNTAALANKALQKKVMGNGKIPFPKTYDLVTRSDLEQLTYEGNKIFGKPVVSFQSIGGVYLESPDDVKIKLANVEDLSEYTFEEFIPADGETRIAFFDGKIFYGRWKPMNGGPGKEKRSGFNCMKQVEPTEDQIRITNEIMEHGFVFGGADFRGDYLLEINGSHVGIRGGKPKFEKDVLDGIERLFS